MGRVRETLTRPVVAGALVVVVALVGVGLHWFQPWKLWQDDTVQEALPEATASEPVGRSAGEPVTPEGPPPSEPVEPVTVAGGELISHEHSTSGTVKLLRLSDGSHILRLENLDTGNGPDLRVWLTDAPVKAGRAGWFVFDDGAYESLGKLKGNKGPTTIRCPPASTRLPSPASASGATDSTCPSVLPSWSAPDGRPARRFSGSWPKAPGRYELGTAAPHPRTNRSPASRSLSCSLPKTSAERPPGQPFGSSSSGSPGSA